MNRENIENKVVSFCCNWSVHPGLKLSECAVPQEDKSIVTMCTGRLTPEMIIEILNYGALGVLIFGCPPGECEHDSNYKTLRRINVLKKILSQFNVEPERVKLEWVKSGEVQKVLKSVESFYFEMKELGPIKKGRNDE